MQYLTNRFGDQYFYEVNRDAFEKVGSQATFQRAFGEQFQNEDTLYIILGTDSGLLPLWLAHKGIPEGSRFLFIEIEALSASVQPKLEAILEHARVALKTLENWTELREDFAFKDYHYLERVHLISSIGAQDAYLHDYREMQKSVNETLEQFRWQVEMQLGSQVFVQRQVENLCENRIPASEFKDCLQGKTAVLLGGGPSLDEILPWVQTHRQNLAVIAVSRICKRLYEVGLQPDVVVSIDPHDVSFDVSKDLFRFSASTLLVCSFHVSPLLLGQWHGPAAYLGPRFPWQVPGDELNLPNQGPTVTNTAFATALKLGVSRIILAGVDLCYSREGHTHAQGSNERKAGPLLGNLGLQVETNGGWMADTRPSFATAVGIMGGQAEKALAGGCKVISPVAGAAKIPNVDYVALADLETPDDSAASVEPLLKAHNLASTLDRKAEHYQKLAKELARVNGRLRAMKKLALEALDCNDGLFGRKGKKADFKYKKRMDKIEKRLDHEYEELAELVKSFGQRRFLRLSRPDKEREWTDQEIEDWGRAYYEAYEESCQTLLDMVESAQARLASRKEELQTEPNFALLFDQWAQDRMPGRAKLWLENRQSDAPLLDQVQRQIDGFLHDFVAELDQTETKQAAWCQKNYTLTPVRSKAALLHQRKDIAGLDILIDELGKLDGEEAEELLLLAQGYLAELQQDMPAALNAYSEMVNKIAIEAEAAEGEYKNPRLEDALKRLSVIAIDLQDLDNALAVLQMLSHLAPVYQPQYAELLRLSGDAEGAIEAYNHYLQRVPKDLAVFLKLGQLYQSVGALEAALSAYQLVLKQDPENAAALALVKELGALAEQAIRASS